MSIFETAALTLPISVGPFRIVSESSVASGVRRIEAVTGQGILDLINGYKNTITDSARALKLANVNELPEKCIAVTAELKEKDKQLESLNQQAANAKTSAMFDNAAEIGSVKAAVSKIDNITPDAVLFQRYLIHEYRHRIQLNQKPEPLLRYRRIFLRKVPWHRVF